MTPPARISAAIEVLDAIQGGEPAERALTNWARANRYAGSGDRAAVRDLVYDTLRRKRSRAALGVGETGRALMVGALRDMGVDPAEMFTGEGYAPPPLTADEMTPPPDPSTLPAPIRLDYPDWLDASLRTSLADDFESVMEAMRHRAPVDLRVNLSKATVESAQVDLANDGITTEPHPLSRTALRVTSGDRRIRNSAAYREGLVELQDAASQAVVDKILPLDGGARVLDFCAGGAGKSLAIAAATGLAVDAHDINSRRMANIPERAARAGADIRLVESDDLPRKDPWDLVIVDAPCSGSGAWRRQPDAKWRLTPRRLTDLRQTQRAILKRALSFVAEGGRLAYITCSMLREENEDVVNECIASFVNIGSISRHRFSPTDGGDGFFCTLLTLSSRK